MKLSARRWIAAGSAALSAAAAVAIGAGMAAAARRPYYGGTLRIELRARLSTLDPRDPPSTPEEFAAKSWIGPLVYEPLVRFDERAAAGPLFASEWVHDGKTKQWIFSFRNSVAGSEPVSSLSLRDDVPLPAILSEQARYANAISGRAADGKPGPATGPFEVARWDPGRGATLVPNARYWGARPYLDSIEILMGRDLKDQALDLSLGKADVTETGDRQGRLTNTLALVFENERIKPGLREALSLAIDRATIQRVLARNGEATHALLPRWLSGYSFVFARDRDVARARQLAAGAEPISFAYDRQDASLRRIGERIVVNAMEAGINLRAVTAPKADLRLELLPVTTNDELAALKDLAQILNVTAAATAPYEVEKALLDGYRVIPVVHLADSWSVSPRVHNWPDVASVWVNP